MFLFQRSVLKWWIIASVFFITTSVFEVLGRDVLYQSANKALMTICIGIFMLLLGVAFASAPERVGRGAISLLFVDAIRRLIATWFWPSSLMSKRGDGSIALITWVALLVLFTIMFRRPMAPGNTGTA